MSHTRSRSSPAPSLPSGWNRIVAWFAGPERLTTAAGVLIVVLTVVAIALGIGYLRTAKENQRRAAVNAGAVAHTVLTAVVNASSIAGWNLLLETFVPASSLGSLGARATLATMDQLAREYAQGCGCNAMIPTAIALANVQPGEVLQAAGPGREQLTAASVRTLLAFVDTAPPGARTIRVLPLADGSALSIAYVRVMRATGRHPVAAAIVIPVSELGPKVFEPARQRVRGALFGDAAGADSIFGLTVRFGESTPVYRSVWTGTGAEWTTRFWTEENPLLEATVVLNPDLIARAVPRAYPPSPVGLVIAASTLLLLVAAAGLFALRRAGHLIASRTLFLSSVSHELRTPLMQILLYAEALDTPRAEPARRAHAVEVIGRETRRLIHMVENVLLYSRSSQRDLALNARDLDLSATVREVLADFEPLYRRSGSRIASRLESREIVRADPTAVRQILTNLLDNAVRYGLSGQTVHVSTLDEGERVVLSVEDEGPGVPDAVLTAIRYGRASVRGAGTGTGVGIGLALTQRMATAMNATLTFSRAEGEARSGVHVSFAVVSRT